MDGNSSSEFLYQWVHRGIVHYEENTKEGKAWGVALSVEKASQHCDVGAVAETEWEADDPAQRE